MRANAMLWFGLVVSATLFLAFAQLGWSLVATFAQAAGAISIVVIAARGNGNPLRTAQSRRARWAAIVAIVYAGLCYMLAYQR
jgi:hypothetical protein